MNQRALFDARSAHIEGRYRYSLRRRWAEGAPMLWVMLNPSTADAETDDATMRRVIAFSKRFGAPACRVVNLFALRSRNPSDLLAAEDPVGPRNDEFLSEAILTSRGGPICAWGAVHPKLRWRLKQAWGFLCGSDVYCLGTTKTGDPRHPLYLRADARMVRLKSVNGRPEAQQAEGPSGDDNE